MRATARSSHVNRNNGSARRRRRLTALVLALCAGLAVVSRAGRTLVVERAVGPPDAIVVLASHESERIPAAATLARQYPTSIVLLTVPRVITEFNCQRCMTRTEWLSEEGVSPARVRTLPDRTVNTRDEALAVLHYWQSAPFARLAVVTSPYHTRRSLSTFQHVFGNTTVQIGSYAATTTSPTRPDRWLLHGYDRRYVIYEWAALAYYRLKFGVPMRLTNGDRHPMPPTSSVPE